MAAACKRLAQFSGFGSSKSFSFKSSLKSFSTNGRICDTSAITRGLEGQGVPTKQAQAITAGITKVLENLQESFLQRIEMLQESNLSKFKAEVQRSQMELQREIEKLRNDMEISHNELRSAIDIAEITSKTQMLSIKNDIGEYCLRAFFTVSAFFLLGRWLAFLG